MGEAVAVAVVVTGEAARRGEVVRSTTREEPQGEATIGQVRMDTGTPGAIGALIAAGSPTVGAARYVGGCLGRGGRAGD